MRALVVERFGEPKDLVLRDWPEPVAGPGEVLVEVHAMGLNFPDLLVIAGTYQNLPPLPFVPGKEAAGVVRAIGTGVTAFAPGDRVAAQLEAGAFAEVVAVPAVHCYRLPDAVSMERAAAMVLVYQTAWFSLVDRARLRPGD
ncbi:MAG: alcohol dehydrogenase catalytic domain-containing protein, partial [Alphaproteobacteria bacterium]|nr:alcohol dehydrogenase catalytic domain-containing protein [Alphaproteobacteria bacterium]